MRSQHKPSANEAPSEAKVDRVVCESGADLKLAAPRLVGFRCVNDYALRNISDSLFLAPYGRVRQLESTSTGTRVFISYAPRYRSLPLIRIATVPTDEKGARRRELSRLIGAFAPSHLSVVEMAVDFPLGTVDSKFVRRHVKFAKSQMRRNSRYPHAVWLGAPRSARFLRCYPKAVIDRFRLEVQFNRSFLQQHQVVRLGDFKRLADVFGKNVGFFEVNWSELRRYAQRHLRHPGEMIRMARERQNNLVEMLKILRSVIPNANRFLLPMPNCVVKHFFYIFQAKDGHQEVVSRTAAQVAECGGIEGVETVLRYNTAWYYPIGVLLCSSWIKTTSDKIYFSFRRVKALVDDWLAQGSPWKRGDHAEEGEVPPKGKPLNGK